MSKKTVYKVYAVTTPYAVSYPAGKIVEYDTEYETYRDAEIVAERRNGQSRMAYGWGKQHFCYYVVAHEEEVSERYWVRVNKKNTIFYSGKDDNPMNRNTVWVTEPEGLIYASGDSWGEAIRRLGEYLEEKGL